MEDNCTGFKSESQDFLKALRPFETALLAVCGLLVLVDIIIFFDNVVFLFCKQRVNQIRTPVATVTWLVALCPILAFICFMSLVIPNAFLFRDVLSTGCISVVMFKFVELASVYIKHYDGLREHIRDNQRLRFDVQPFACCCKCLPTAPMNRPRVLFLKGLVLQFPLVTLPISILTVYLWVDNKYNMGEYAADSPWVYLTVIKVVSTLTAMYGLGVLYAAVREPLSATYISQKYMALKLCALLNNIQHFVFRILSSNDVFHSRDCFTGRVMGDFYENTAFSFELFAISLLNLWAYRRPFGDPINIGESTFGPQLCVETPRIKEKSEAVFNSGFDGDVSGSDDHSRGEHSAPSAVRNNDGACLADNSHKPGVAIPVINIAAAGEVNSNAEISINEPGAYSNKEQ